MLIRARNADWTTKWTIGIRGLTTTRCFFFRMDALFVKYLQDGLTKDTNARDDTTTRCFFFRIDGFTKDTNARDDKTTRCFFFRMDAFVSL